MFKFNLLKKAAFLTVFVFSISKVSMGRIVWFFLNKLRNFYYTPFKTILYEIKIETVSEIGIESCLPFTCVTCNSKEKLLDISFSYNL
jgi:hypothetical protein